MAKALLGYATGFDPHVASRLSTENRFLRQRVTDLEQIVLRLQKENDTLVSMAADAADRAPSPDEVLEPA